ncbi:MAG: hypothetical protein ACRCZI_02620 [Cetobacterium sp.]
MATAKTKQVETPVKKTLKKKTVDVVKPEPVVEKEVTKPKAAVKETNAKKSDAKEPKTKKTSAKEPKTKKTSAKEPKAKKSETKEVKAKAEPKAKKEGEPEKEKKAPKAVNTKPVLADSQGLNLSVAKVKNIVADFCINRETSAALEEIKKARVFEEADAPEEEEAEDEEVDIKKSKNFEFSLEGLSVETIAFFKESQEEYNASLRSQHAQQVIKGFSKDQKDQYLAAKQLATQEFQNNHRKNFLFLQTSFEVDKFNESYDATIFDDLVDLDAWTELENMELYRHVVSVINKRKIRFNAESKIFITAFVEYITKQLVINGTRNCVASKKKIIQLKHAVSTINPDFILFPFVSSTGTYHKFIANEELEEGEADEEDEEPTEASGRVLQFKYYVGELCRGVRMELSANDSSVEDPLLSKFNQTSVSKAFKQFCSDVIIDLLHIFGKTLKMEVVTRDVKTVNYDIVSSLIYGSHIIHNVPYDDTIEFIQKTYNMYNEFVVERQHIRTEKKAEKEAEKASA